MPITHFRRLDRRRTLRVAISVPVQVRARTDSIDRFHVRTRTLSINSRGALIELCPEVAVGDVLLLVNINSGKSAESRVVSLRRGKDGKIYVGVEFTKENPAFWSMNFPCPGTRPLRRPAPAGEGD